jgi:hypothetical protein
MLKEILLRTVMGGVFVTFFACLGDVIKPKSFAGIFGAAPSVALAPYFQSLLRRCLVLSPPV